LIQALRASGGRGARFANHERLSIAGNCRMFLVESLWVGPRNKPAASCAMLSQDLRPDLKGAPPVVKPTRPWSRRPVRGVMEFLLINHRRSNCRKYVTKAASATCKTKLKGPTVWTSQR